MDESAWTNWGCYHVMPSHVRQKGALYKALLPCVAKHWASVRCCDCLSVRGPHCPSNRSATMNTEDPHRAAPLPSPCLSESQRSRTQRPRSFSPPPLTVITSHLHPYNHPPISLFSPAESPSPYLLDVFPLPLFHLSPCLASASCSSSLSFSSPRPALRRLTPSPVAQPPPTPWPLPPSPPPPPPSPPRGPSTCPTPSSPSPLTCTASSLRRSTTVALGGCGISKYKTGHSHHLHDT